MVAEKLQPTPLPVVETFHSIQGEGRWVGTSAFFIRLAGCNVGCAWCDTKESWNAARHPNRAIADIATEAIASKARFVVITGGEPLMHNLSELTASLRSRGQIVHLETSGAYPLTGNYDWVTLSPKPTKPPHPSVYRHADELKIVITEPGDFRWAEEQASKVAPTVSKLLQPEWYSVGSGKLVYQYILDHPTWQMSLQTHKYVGIR
jgi:7-carboxy-7-deazaguanine synthase